MAEQLMIKRLENIEIMKWANRDTNIRFTIHGVNGTEEDKGYIDLWENVFYPRYRNTLQRTQLFLETLNGIFLQTDGDYIRLTFNGGNRVYVFFPSTGIAGALYSIDTQGNLYMGPKLNILIRESEIPPDKIELPLPIQFGGILMLLLTVGGLYYLLRRK